MKANVLSECARYRGLAGSRLFSWPANFSRGVGQLLQRFVTTRRSELPSLAGAWPEQLMIEQLDVVEDSEIDALSARLSGARADLLFVNVGIIHDKKVTAETISRDEFTRLMQINALGPARVAERLMDHVAPNGTVAAMTSELASIANNDDASWDCYRASKAALNMLMRSTAACHAGEARSFSPYLTGLGEDRSRRPCDATLEIDESIPRVVDQIEAVAGATGLHCVDYKGDTLPW